MKALSLIFLITIPFIFFSCGDEKTKLPPKEEVIEPQEIDACSLVDITVVDKIFNLKMNEPRKGRSQKGDAKKASFSECSFESEGEGSKTFLSIYVRFTPRKNEYHTTIQSIRNSFKQSGIEVSDITGIGEVAFWGGNQLHVFRGDNYYFIITLLGITDQDEAIEKAKAVALHVMSNADSV
jgi:hypothetical protein